MTVSTGRTEKRSAWAAAVELSSLDSPLPPETTFTENVSPHGARIVGKHRWQPGDRVFLKTLAGDLRAQAHVIYCEILPGSSFAVGLRLLARTGEWSGIMGSRPTRGNKPVRNRRFQFQAPIVRFPWAWAY